ncbi:MAG: hypothetical protein ABWX96_08660 [Propionibacteriaceae bacterium]
MSTVRKPGPLHVLGLGAAMVAVAAAPLALAIPADAATASNGCVVNPLQPTNAGVVVGVKQVRYDFQVACAANRTIEVQQMLFEEDAPPDPDDFTATQITSKKFINASAGTLGMIRSLPNTEAGNEEVYQRTRFRVSVNGGAPSAWTLFESGAIRSIAN